MKTVRTIFGPQGQRELSGFLVYPLEESPADGQTAVRCIALDAKERVLRCCFLIINAESAEYELIVLQDVYGPLRGTEFDESGTVGGLRCVVGVLDGQFLKVTGVPEASIFRMDRQRAIHYGRFA
jgi:hypothetical protein